jgi:hypothetical protein
MSVEKLLPFLLTIGSILLGIVGIEILCRLFLPSIANRDREPHVIYFFDGPSTIFRNYGDIFTYVPNSDIKILTVSYSEKDFRIEYDNDIQTNNFGLVQDSAVNPGKVSFMLLGDSFTEGVGASPWFPLASTEISKLGYQPINGGIGGSGFGSWLKLDRYLAAADINIRKVVILFISDDFHRPVWNVRPNELRCLSDQSSCSVGSEVFFRYRLPPPEALASWVTRIREARATTLGAQAQALVPATYYIYKQLSERLRLTPGARARVAWEERGEDEARAAIGEFIKIYGPKNVAFLHLPEKGELASGPDSLGLNARRSIQQAGGKLLDGFVLCHLTEADYHPNDLHPNRRGYEKIAACTADVIKQMAIQ